MDIVDPQYKSADGSALRIWRDAAKNNFLSEKNGRPLFDDVTYVEVISPGSRDSTPVFEVRRLFCAEAGRDEEPLYGTKWDDYKEFVADFDKSEEVDQTLAGTPLAEWKEVSRTMVASLKAQNIFTVEALANLPDSRLLAVGPDGRTWRTKAQAYIDSALHFGQNTQLAAENERMRADLNTAQQTIAQLVEQVKQLVASLDGDPPPPPPPPPPPEVDPLTGLPPAPAPII